MLKVFVEKDILSLSSFLLESRYNRKDGNISQLATGSDR